MTDTEPTLSGLRGEIDRLDDSLVDLLVERARVAAGLAPLKPADAPYLRPGREAEVLRRLAARAGDALDIAALVRIWREIISAALRRQGPLSVAVSAPDGGPACWALARDHYGAATPMTALASPAQAVAAVAAGEATVAVVPFPAAGEDEPWWPRLVSARAGAPRAVARLPAASGLDPADGCHDGLAVACLAPEPSGEDRSLVALETTAEVSRAGVRAALEEAGLAVRFAASAPGARPEAALHLIEADGFLETGSPALDRLAVTLGDRPGAAVVVGAYAVPLGGGNGARP